MATTQIYTATQARQNFFKILDEVQRTGKSAIVKKDNTKHFVISFRKPETKESAESLIREWDAIKIKSNKSMSIKEMKKIILTLHDINL